MKYFIKKIYLILFLVNVLFHGTATLAKSGKIEYSRDNISNYFSGIVSANQDHTEAAFKYLNKVKLLENTHFNFKLEFIRTLILLEKFEKAFVFSKNIWHEDELFFEVDLLLGLESFIKKDYARAQKYFERINKISHHNSLFGNFLGNFLLTWIKASENNETDSFKFSNKISKQYNNLTKIQNSFLRCYFNDKGTQLAFEQLIGDKDFSFSRYNFFLAKYIIHENNNAEAKKIISLSR